MRIEDLSSIMPKNPEGSLVEFTRSPELIRINIYEHDGYLWEQFIWDNTGEDDDDRITNTADIY